MEDFKKQTSDVASTTTPPDASMQTESSKKENKQNSVAKQAVAAKKDSESAASSSKEVTKKTKKNGFDHSKEAASSGVETSKKKAKTTSAPAHSSETTLSSEPSLKDDTLENFFSPDIKLDEAPLAVRKTKDKFLESDLIFPAIAIKKMQQAMSQEGAIPQNFIAVLGENTVEMHRTSKPGVRKMVLADICRFRETFWSHVSKHFQGIRISVVLVAANSPLSMEDAS